MHSVGSCTPTTMGVEDSMGLAAEYIEFNFETMKKIEVAESKNLTRLTDLPVIRCFFKVVITVTFISIKKFKVGNNEPDSINFKPIANSPKGFNKFLFIVVGTYDVIYEKVCSRCVAGVSIWDFLCI